MVGGDKPVFDKAKPVFDVLGKNIHYLGPSGAGSVIKLVNQLLGRSTPRPWPRRWSTA